MFNIIEKNYIKEEPVRKKPKVSNVQKLLLKEKQKIIE